LEGAGVLAEEARKRADAASQRAKAAEERCRLAVEAAQQKASLAEKRASDAEQRVNDVLQREEALRTQSRKDLADVRNDAKRQRKVFQDFRREKDDLQKRYDKQHAELLEAKSRQATLKLRVGALQTASQSKSPRREVVEKDRLRAEEDAQRKRTDEAARRRLRDIRQCCAASFFHAVDARVTAHRFVDAIDAPIATHRSCTAQAEGRDGPREAHSRGEDVDHNCEGRKGRAPPGRGRRAGARGPPEVDGRPGRV
jgi:hypothetical protein